MKKLVLIMTIIGLVSFILLPVLLATGCSTNGPQKKAVKEYAEAHPCSYPTLSVQ